MTKARTLADFISDGSPLADGTISVSEVSGAAPLANPTFTGNIDAGDNVKIRLGDSDDLQIYHDGFDSIINDAGTGNLFIRGTSTIVLGGVTSNNVLINDGADVKLRYNSEDKLATTSTGVDITGNINLADSGKAVFGDSDDLQIYHAGSYSMIEDTGSGNLIFRTDGTSIFLQGGTETMAVFTKDGASDLYHNGSSKLVTTSTGVDITGEVKADKFTNDEALPTVRPSLLLDFANSKTLDPRITFTRGTTATYWDGKTTTKAEENLVKSSQNIVASDTYWDGGRATFTSNAATAPDGTTTAANFQQASGQTTNGYISTTPQPTFTSDDYTWSVYAKSNGKNFLGIYTYSVGSSGYVWFNLSTGAVGTINSAVDSATITDVGNGWYRCTCTRSGTNANRMGFFIADTNGSTTVFDSGGIYLWGAQLEQRSSATAYTPTTSSPIVKYQPTLQTAASGEARFDHDPVTGESKGLLIEEARTNRMLMSERITSSSWSRAGTIRTGDVAIAPDGTQSADWLQQENSSVNYIYQSVSVTQGDPYTISCYVKKPPYKGSSQFHFNWDNSSVTVDLSTSTPSFSNIDGSEHVGNGWYRFWKTITASGSTINTYTYPNLGRNVGYGGLVWGFQLERGNFPTSYIKTESSTVTRSFDSAEITGTSFDFFNNQESSLYAEVDMTYSGGGSKGILSVNGDISGTSGRLLNMYLSQSLQFYFDNYSFGSVSVSGNGGPTPPTKVALGFSTTEYIVAVDGSQISNPTGSYYMDQATSLKIGGAYNSNSYPLNGHLKKIACYPQQLTSATLQAMTEE